MYVLYMNLVFLARYFFFAWFSAHCSKVYIRGNTWKYPTNQIQSRTS